MRSICAALFALSFALPAAAQSADSVYQIADEMPTLLPDARTAMAGLQRAIAYPDSARAAGVEGTVLVRMVVDANGDVADPVVLRGVDPALDAEALRVVHTLGLAPGRIGGRPVRVSMTLPVSFRIALADALDEARGLESESFVTPDSLPRLLPSQQEGIRAIQSRLKYPEQLRREGMEGTVAVRFVVDEQGRPQEISIHESSNPGFDDAAIRAVRDAKFQPAFKDGAPVRAPIVLPLTFRIAPGSKAVLETAREKFEIVEETPELLPSFSRGMRDLQKRVRYPEAARQAGVEGKVIVQFIVDTDGSVEAPFVVESPSALLNEAALEAIRTTRWRPGSTGGELKRVQMTIPVYVRPR